MPRRRVSTLRKRTFDHESAEFGRLLAFSDGVFAIAMTLLVVGIAVPTLDNGGSVAELWDALGDLIPNFISFFISFAVIGRYWVAHHQFFSLLGRIDQGILGINLVYLAFIAFLPFPTALLGNYFENPLTIALYAFTVAIVSGMEVVQFRHAYRHGLLREPMSPEVFRWGAMMSLSPVIFFVLSMPIAFLSTGLAVAVWFLAVPFGVLADRWKPPDADRVALG